MSLMTLWMGGGGAARVTVTVTGMAEVIQLQGQCTNTYEANSVTTSAVSCR